MPQIPIWLSIIIGPAFWYVLYFLIKGFLSLWRNSLRGSGLFQWPWIVMIYLGTKFVSKRYCHFRVFENRWYFSLKAPCHAAPVDIPDRKF
jgi:hypothetical protein